MGELAQHEVVDVRCETGELSFETRIGGRGPRGLFRTASDGTPAAAPALAARLREAAEQRGLPLHRVETNLRELSDPLVRWDSYYGCALVSVALFLAPLFERILIAGDSDHEVQVAMGANRLVNQLWSTEQLEIVEDGGRYSRAERVQRIAADPVVQETLRVCWENPGGSYNCGRCRKCLMTMITLEAFDALADVETFPSELDLDAVADIE